MGPLEALDALQGGRFASEWAADACVFYVWGFRPQPWFWHVRGRRCWTLNMQKLFCPLQAQHMSLLVGPDLGFRQLCIYDRHDMAQVCAAPAHSGTGGLGAREGRGVPGCASLGVGAHRAW